MLQRQGKSGGSAPIGRIKASYLNSKSRLFDALEDGNRLSYGVREEHRISLSFFRQLIEALRRDGNWDTAPVLVPADYEHIWELSSDDYTTYLWLNTNKYLAAIEWIISFNPTGEISYDHYQVLSILLKALLFAFDTGPLGGKGRGKGEI